MTDSEAGELLCKLLRQPDTLAGERLHALSEGDWARVAERARQEGVAALLRQRLTDDGRAALVPATVAERLDGAYYGTASGNVWIYHRLEDVLAMLGERSIPVLLLKGAYLAEHVYRNVAVRPIGDLDLLVPRNRLQEAAALLRQHGYEAPVPFVWKQERHDDHLHHLAPLAPPGTRLWIELHWHLLPPAGSVDIDIQKIWQRSTPAPRAGAPAAMPAPADLLLHLCVHTAFVDMFERGLRPLCDLAEVLRVHAGDLDWARFRREAERCGCHKHVAAAIHLTADLLQPPLPRPAGDLLPLTPVDTAIVRAARRFVLSGCRSSATADRRAGLRRPWAERANATTLRQRLLELRRLSPGDWGSYLRYARHLCRQRIADWCGQARNTAPARRAREAAAYKAQIAQWADG